MKALRVAIAYGSNLGDRESNISRALDLLAKGGFTISAVSDPVTSEPVDCTPESGIFLNGALTGTWNSSVNELLSLCQEIEIELGRMEVREINSPRPVDLDILLVEDMKIDEEFLKVPHPRMHLRDFVMSPLSEIAPDWVHPGLGKKVHEIAGELH